MTELPKAVSNWLYNVIESQYINKEVVYSHVYKFLQKHLKGGLQFKIRTKVHTSGISGQSTLLINLFATVKINDLISIPLELWVPLSYPYVDHNSNVELNGLPIVYVVPDHSKNWYLRANNCIDTQGKFYHPYLTDWFGRCTADSLDKFNLVTLVDIFVDLVTRDIPITGTPFRASPVVVVPGQFTSQSATQFGVQSPAAEQSTGARSPIAEQFGPRSIIGQVSGLSGPPLPPKPAKVPLRESVIPSERLITSGRLIPPERLIPLKYQAPLPLPSERLPERPLPERRLSTETAVYRGAYSTGNTQAEQTPEYRVPVNGNIPYDQNRRYDQNQRYNQNQRYDQNQRDDQNQQYNQNQVQHDQNQVQRVQNHVHHDQRRGEGLYDQRQHLQQREHEIIPTYQQSSADLLSPKVIPTDLVDNDDRSGVTTSIGNELLQLLSQNINLFLQNESVNTLLPEIKQNEIKVDALHGQLQLHYDKAKANAQIIDDHISQLKQQLNKLTNLKANLQKLDTLNNEQLDKVYTSETQNTSIDDIIIPDLPLVKQLYETVLEIKAIKDTINLIGGNFHGQPEIINDDRLVVCVKTVRNLGRELFWLELTKNEISCNILGLTQL